MPRGREQTTPGAQGKVTNTPGAQGKVTNNTRCPGEGDKQHQVPRGSYLVVEQRNKAKSIYMLNSVVLQLGIFLNFPFILQKIGSTSHTLLLWEILRLKEMHITGLEPPWCDIPN